MTRQQLYDCLERSPVIASFHEQAFEKALEAPPEILFDLRANLKWEDERIKAAHKKGKFIFVHIDLADGIGKDKTGIEYLAGLGVDGIISTRAGIIKSARENGMATVQRVFIVDSHSIATAADTIQKNSPDMIELMPGIATKAIAYFKDRVEIPIIAGGLIETHEEAELAHRLGAFAVSTGKKELW